MSDGSILAHLRAHLGPDGLAPAGYALPDGAGDGRSGWAPGAEEHLRRAHLGPRDASADVDAMAAACAAVLAGEAPEPVRTLDDAFAAHGRLEAADALGDAVGRLSEHGDWPALYGALRALAERTPSTPALKMALVLLGRFRRPEDAPLFETVAHHPELSLYATVALACLPGDEPQAPLLGLLPLTRGWAQADVVEALCRFADDPAVRAALLGPASHMPAATASYVALAVAQAVPLRDALADPEGDADQAEGAARWVARLATDAVEGARVGTLDHVPDALEVVEALAARDPDAGASLATIDALHAARRWLAGPPDEREAAGQRSALRSRVADALARPEAAAAVRAALAAPGTPEASTAARLATSLGLRDCADAVLTHCRAWPLDAAALRAAFELGGAEAAPALLALLPALADASPGDPPRALRTLGPALPRTLARAAIIGRVGGLALAEASAAVLAALADPEPDVRAAAIVACLDREGPASPEVEARLRERLGDGAPVVAAAAAGACGPLRLTAARDQLASLAAGHPDAMVRQAAERSLAALAG